ncbi:MAG: ROK family protein [Candidatus Bathyarchaeota archaeon]|nr:MAG: ROK family protein [Candidatus Bathyarchaeota archaeon]
MGRRTKTPLTMGIDLGGTKVRIALVDSQGKVLHSLNYPTKPEKKADEIINDIMIYADECLDKIRKKVKALGIGVPGQVDFDGVVRYAPNLNWHDVPLKSKLERGLRMPVAVVNDVNAATWGEWSYGSGTGVGDLVVLFVGTGVGGGVVSGGRILTGCNNTAGELGHMTLVEGGRSCHCPNKGCLEAYIGGWAIAERAQEAVRTNPKEGTHLISLAGNVEEISAKTVSQAYRRGDMLAEKLIEETGQHLAAGMVSIVNAFNPCLAVLGGGVIEGVPELVRIVDTIIRRRALKASVEKLKVVKATLGDKAGVIGAAALAQTKIEEATSML